MENKAQKVRVAYFSFIVRYVCDAPLALSDRTATTGTKRDRRPERVKTWAVVEDYCLTNDEEATNKFPRTTILLTITISNRRVNYRNISNVIARTNKTISPIRNVDFNYKRFSYYIDVRPTIRSFLDGCPFTAGRGLKEIRRSPNQLFHHRNPVFARRNR